MSKPIWHGVYPALTTKFKPDYRLDVAAFKLIGNFNDRRGV